MYKGEIDLLESDLLQAKLENSQDEDDLDNTIHCEVRCEEE